jgi:hypothetical protein
MPLTSITVERLNAVVPAIGNFKIYGSLYRQPRTPAQDGTLTDWTQIGADITSNTADSFTRTLSATRYQWILITITAMETVPYRAIINHIVTETDTDVFNADRVLTSADAADVVDRLLQNGGLTTSAITDSGSTTAIDNTTTAVDFVTDVIRDVAELTRTRITVDRASKITLAPDPVFDGTGTYPAASSTLTDAELVDWNFEWKLNRNIGQIELLWKGTSGVDHDAVYYPVTMTTGRRLTVGPHIYADSTAAQAGAQKLFFARRIGFDISSEIVGNGRAYRPGQVHLFQWQVDGDMLTMSRKGLITAADHRIENGKWKTVVHAVQLERTDRR